MIRRYSRFFAIHAFFVAEKLHPDSFQLPLWG